MNESSHYCIEPFFLPFGNELLFCIYLAPKSKRPHAGILYLHPFAEEMHKSRRMAGLQARQFALEGYAVLLIDLLGCGDSSGDFEDASWDKWKACTLEGFNWLEKKINIPIVIWGLRLGATLAIEMSYQLPKIAGLILWQPVTNGESYLNQLLRIRVVSEMFFSNQQNSGTKQLRSLIASGESVEIGGYMLSSVLASDIERIILIDAPINCPVCWFEFLHIPTQSLSPSSLKIINYWNNVGIDVHSHVIYGEPFWASQEIIQCPDLLTKTSKAITIIAP